jgi:Brp/Blh family beta-carotene 15,15'-monooxygenase
MIRFLLIITGFLLMLSQQFIFPVSTKTQFIIFLVGILILGVPHGAADLLVANQKAEHEKKVFSKYSFLFKYVFRLGLFASILWFFPLLGNLLFLLFAAYHFGETDLYRFKTDTFAGKLFVISYGLVILGIILLHHFHEVMPMFQQFESGVRYLPLINWINESRYILLSVFGVFFFASTFYYFASTDNQYPTGDFLIQFGLILIILFNLPMMLGFTFYFIVWHSILSLRNIVSYLRNDGLFSNTVILKNIGFYSLLSMAGISLFGLAGFMFINVNTMAVYVFLGLAVLTAPHLQIMHDMYCSIRSRSAFSS